MSRISEYFRDPTLERPVTDYYVVRGPWGIIEVDRDEAARIITALCECGGSAMIRCQTVYGSVVYVRAQTIAYVRECTRAQRDAAREFWKALDEEDSEEGGIF